MRGCHRPQVWMERHWLVKALTTMRGCHRPQVWMGRHWLQCGVAGTGRECWYMDITGWWLCLHGLGGHTPNCLQRASALLAPLPWLLCLVHSHISSWKLVHSYTVISARGSSCTRTQSYQLVEARALVHSHISSWKLVHSYTGISARGSSYTVISARGSSYTVISARGSSYTVISARGSSYTVISARTGYIIVGPPPAGNFSLTEKSCNWKSSTEGTMDGRGFSALSRVLYRSVRVRDWGRDLLGVGVGVCVKVSGQDGYMSNMVLPRGRELIIIIVNWWIDSVKQLLPPVQAPPCTYALHCPC